MGYMKLKYRKNVIAGVHGMLNYNNTERTTENHWGLIEIGEFKVGSYAG
jgi:hypothetical protein